MMKQTKSWEDISVEQYVELLELNEDAEFQNGSIDFIMEQISVLYDIDSEDDFFNELDVDELFDIVDSFTFLRKVPSGKFKRTVKDMKIKETKDLYLGEYIDLEYFFQDGYFKNLNKICSILYRNYRTDEWGNEIEEPYIFNIDARKELFNEVSINDVFGVVNYYQNFKDKFMLDYGILFESVEDEELEDLEILSPQERKDVEEDIANAKMKSAFAWESQIWKLCNGDITKFSDAFGTKLYLVFNVLSMLNITDQ